MKLHDDFADILDPEMPESKRQDEINLMYVAATRARKILIPDPVLSELLAQPPASALFPPLSEAGISSPETGGDKNDVA
ncbi:hypothetical protein AO411_2031275 [Salmonella enterica subsp. enterica serovar Sarajane]|nr:hypothetical protein AO411_2031275 [Salmonella enterica subsp. enterica serovar Sarajane]